MAGSYQAKARAACLAGLHLGQACAAQPAGSLAQMG
ncbi:hypothetical protein COLO4_08857 [Corchorus olitorius]|uniref:Uncharacterized protein n=1 Tax=Corchorus olitorius TaxID=93759 RepID=A0A1R3KEA5_9ROSI|nr:hypothetical protein COLO4_08857 [Corchorus olitorius]